MSAVHTLSKNTHTKHTPQKTRPSLHSLVIMSQKNEELAKAEAPTAIIAKKTNAIVRHGKRDGKKSDRPSRPEWRRLARRGGCKRLSHSTYEGLAKSMDAFLSQILLDSLRYTQHARRKTVTTNDVLHALKRNNKPMYGYDA